MELSELNDQYKKDAQVDQLNLEQEALNANSLHAKWVRLWTEERKKLSRLSRKYRELYNEKDKFYSQGPSKETQAKGWEYPGGKILKSQVSDYLKADEHLNDLQEEVDDSSIKVDALEKIVHTLSFRKNLIDTILNIRKWEGGA